MSCTAYCGGVCSEATTSCQNFTSQHNTHGHFNHHLITHSLNPFPTMPSSPLCSIYQTPPTTFLLPPQLLFSSSSAFCPFPSSVQLIRNWSYCPKVPRPKINLLILSSIKTSTLLLHILAMFMLSVPSSCTTSQICRIEGIEAKKNHWQVG